MTISEETLQRSDIVTGMGYTDARCKNVGLPKMWKHWSLSRRLDYLGGLWYGYTTEIMQICRIGWSRR